MQKLNNSGGKKRIKDEYFEKKFYKWKSSSPFIPIPFENISNSSTISSNKRSNSIFYIQGEEKKL